MPLTDKEIVEYQLIINSIKADEKIFALKRGIKEMSLEIKKFSTDMGVSINEAAAYMKKLSAEALMTKQRLGEITQAQRLVMTDNFNRKVDDASKLLTNAGKSASSFSAKINVLRVALGALSSMVVFGVIQKITETFRKAEEAATQFETSLFRLANAERILSQGGIETSMAGLKKGIQDIKKLLPIFSEVDITEQVSLVAIMTKEMGITEQKIIDIAKAIGVLNIRSGEEEDLLSTTRKITTALVAPSGKGLSTLGLDFSKDSIEAAALKYEILEVGEAFSELTKHDKDMLKIAILLENTGEELVLIEDFLKTNTGAIAEQSAAWEDMLRVLGEFRMGVKASLAPNVLNLIRNLEIAITAAKQIRVMWTATQGALAAGWEILGGIVEAYGWTVKSVFSGNFKDAVGFFDLLKSRVGQIGQDLSDGIEDGWREGLQRFFPEILSDSDEATGAINELEDEVIDLSELDLDDLNDDLEKLARKAQEAKEEFEIAGDRAKEDFGIKRDRLNEDYALKREDILRDSNKKIADIQSKSRKKELSEEAKFQEKMRQLREKFLFNLEDALRERDARQVLRLQRKYEMDKQAAINENDIKKKDSRDDAARQLREAIDDRNERLALLEQERQLKLARQREDFNLKRQRAKENHKRELEDIARQVDERLVLLVEKAIEANLISEEAADLLLENLTKVYGSGGLFDKLYSANTESMLRNAKEQLAGMNGIITAALRMQAAVAAVASNVRTNVASIMASRSINQPVSSSYSSATTSVLANRALNTPVSLSNYTPSSVPSSGLSGGSSGGDLRVSVDLSPDLEARIVDSSLDNVSVAINRLTRESKYGL